MISVIIPNYNGGPVLERCLASVFASRHRDFEVIVVDDCSTDDSVQRITKYPSRMVRMPQRVGPARARNQGARVARGDVLFFIDADCLVMKHTLGTAEASALLRGPDTVVGGSYTPLPADAGILNTFQSVFIHYCETKKPDHPDYIASHAMVIHAEAFYNSGGFPENFLPILEDVELSHRLRRQGMKLVMEPDLLVRHVFNFNLFRSLSNAVRKSSYWVLYSLGNQDLFRDSGTASRELKIHVLLYCLSLLAVLAALTGQGHFFLPAAVLIQGANLLWQRPLLTTLKHTGGNVFFAAASAYYLLLYPWAVIAGTCMGLGMYFFDRQTKTRVKYATTKHLGTEEYRTGNNAEATALSKLS